MGLMRAVLKMGLAALLMGVMLPCAIAQTVELAGRQKAPLRMKEVSRAQMRATDRDLLDQAHGRLVRQAEIFGFHLDEPGWKCDQVLTPDVPDYLMLACQRQDEGRRGASAFSALVARHGKAVYVVPVMFEGAAPWKTSANMKMSREMFNHVVPAKIAEAAMKPTGKWMTLALTYTALAGDHSVVLAARSSKLKWLNAPEPTIFLGSGSRERTVEFSDVARNSGVRIWKLTFGRAGRLRAAQARMHPNAQITKVSTATPKRKKMLKTLPAPTGKALPAGKTQH